MTQTKNVTLMSIFEFFLKGQVSLLFTTHVTHVTHVTFVHDYSNEARRQISFSFSLSNNNHALFVRFIKRVLVKKDSS
jgi:hypothetical protein